MEQGVITKFEAYFSVTEPTNKRYCGVTPVYNLPSTCFGPSGLLSVGTNSSQLGVTQIHRCMYHKINYTSTHVKYNPETELR
jgi:hypothetical protein